MRFPDRLLPAQDMPVGQGFLNTLKFWVDDHGKQYVSRSPNHDRSVSSSNLEEELHLCGFIRSGGSFKYRNNAEQLEFVRHARKKRLNVVPILGEWNGELVLPWIQGVDLHRYLKQDVSLDNLVRVITPALADICHAHHPRCQTVYGDRWLKNIMVEEGGRVRHIDFDIDIYGPKAREFEMAQFLYSLVKDTGNTERLLVALRECRLKRRLRHHDKTILADFLLRYPDWYGHKYPDQSARLSEIRQGVEQIALLL